MKNIDNRIKKLETILKPINKSNEILESIFEYFTTDELRELLKDETKIVEKAIGIIKRHNDIEPGLKKEAIKLFEAVKDE